MVWIRKIQFYKNLLIAFWCINIVLICTTLIASFRFFQSGASFEKAIKNQEKIIRVLSLENEIAHLASVPHRSEDDLFEYRKRTENLKNELNSISDLPTELREFAQSTKWKVSPQEWSLLSASLLRWTEAQLKAGYEAHTQVNRTTNEMVFLGTVTLLFGILLPLIVFALLTRYLLKAKRSLEEKASTWVAQIVQKLPTNGESAWVNPALWVEILLVSIEVFAPQSRHPALLVLREVLPTIKNELAKPKA